MDNMKELPFASDYMEGCDPAILDKLVKTNLEASEGYGLDAYSESAREKIRKACGCSEAEVWFVTGGTQANMIMLDAMAQSYEAVLTADTGHIVDHEAGAVERTGHKVIGLPQSQGKIDASSLKQYMEDFLENDNHDHMVQPGVVYISQPTEYGTLYSLKELQGLSDTAHSYGLRLYCDGARLAYALGSDANDVNLSDLARCCDAFYIGGTKCGALFGEAVVVPVKNAFPHLFTQIKAHGALLAKGRIAGIQFDVLFTDQRYIENGKRAVKYAGETASALQKKGYALFVPQVTNQIFVRMDNAKLEALKDRLAYTVWEKIDESHTLIRLVTSWASTSDNVNALISAL